MKQGRRIYLDTETYSPVDLKAAGAYRYSEHPEHEVLMCAYQLESEPTRVAVGEDEIALQVGPYLKDPGYLKIAHNSAFDRVNLSAMLGMPPGEYLDPGQWDDSMAMAAENGLPQSLEKLAVAVGAELKDSAGTSLVSFFSKPTRDGRRRTEQDDPDKWEAFVRYCAQDVDTLVDVCSRMPGWPSPQEYETWVLDQRINDRGIRVDVPLAQWALDQDAKNRQVAEARLARLLGIENANSVQQLKAGLESTGLEIPDLRVGTVSALLADYGVTGVARQALELRAELALTAAKKYKAVVQGASGDGRLRGQFRFYGAHTGRWSGRGVQLQNLPRAQLRFPDAVILDSQLGLSADAQTLKALIRQVLVGPFVVSDYSAIEARVLAWVADESWALEAFGSGRDIYVETANRMGGMSRQQGKVAVLALGYQGGVNSLRHMGAKGNDEELDRIKVQWRRANPQIVSLWAKTEEAFVDGGEAGRIRVEVAGRDRKVRLPSGRTLTYRNVKHETWRVQADDRTVRKTGWRFDGGLGRTDTYGGRLVENVVQAIARDLLAELIVRLEGKGLGVVGHVHDEILLDCTLSGKDPDELRLLVQREMESSPSWASGLPLGAEGFVTERYRKG